MSRSNPNEQLQNVATRFYQWSGDSGGFKYYDKPSKENIDVPVGTKTPFTFIVLDTLSTIKGYSDSEGSGFWSNEVKDLAKEVLTVRTKSGVQAVGLYADIKDKISAKGAKFTQSVYIAIKGEKGLEIANIQMTGSSLSEWINFCKTVNIYEVAIQVKSTEEKKKGKTVYQVPVFTSLKVAEKTNEEAKALDVQLQQYLSAYLSKNASAPAEKVAEGAEAKSEAKPKSNSKTESKSAAIEEDVEDITFDPEDDDVPF